MYPLPPLRPCLRALLLRPHLSVPRKRRPIRAPVLRRLRQLTTKVLALRGATSWPELESSLCISCYLFMAFCECCS
ncbi:hypothetical protein OH76DRAFT_972101 [Lentinus brumalis]|uniref:Uncharacterized protein n=1 Tax=Lentinus brumalis TaxID=2498619 RepID=A0A371DPN9_9APHY|nr:hypothetical protein OH76DRAFT_972101 [Polyporus brumalis]